MNDAHSSSETLRRRPAATGRSSSKILRRRRATTSSTSLASGWRRRRTTSQSTLAIGLQRQYSVYKEENILQPVELKGKETLNLRWWHAIFVFSGVSLLVCLLQIFLPPPFGFRMKSSEIAAIGVSPGGCADGLERCICPRATVCATDVLSMTLLACARCSAFFDYPLYMMMFLSKAHNVNNVLRRTILREWIDFADMHRVHSLFGLVIGVEAMSHSFFHMLRWGINNDIRLLWETSTGVTGLIAMCATPLIVWPMFLPRLKKMLQFEVRKGLHYLLYFWAASLMRHAPARIFYMIGVPFILYVVDFFFGLFVRNHLIENVYFERYGEEGVAVSVASLSPLEALKLSYSYLYANTCLFVIPVCHATQLHFENPKGFDTHKTSYVYIMCPWISKWQWHAFTAFPEPTKKEKEGTMLCIGSSGDWTKKMYDTIKTPCMRSVYITGPFSSEFSDMAVDTMNAIAIASGIGITPTLSLMISYAGKKRINVVWICRDPGLVEYILHKMDISAVTEFSFIMIYYTGKRELLLPKNLPINIFIFRSRPKLEEVITGIVAAIHFGEGLPEEMYENQKALNEVSFDERIKAALCRVTTIYSKEEMFQYAVDETVAEFLALEDTPKTIRFGDSGEDSTAAVPSKHIPKTIRFADSEDATASIPSKHTPETIRFADNEDETAAVPSKHTPKTIRFADDSIAAIPSKHIPKTIRFADIEDATASILSKHTPKAVKFADSEDATATFSLQEPQSVGSISAAVDSLKEGPDAIIQGGVRFWGGTNNEEDMASPDAPLEECVRDFSGAAEFLAQDNYVDLEADTRENALENIPSGKASENWAFQEEKISSSVEGNEMYHEFLRVIEGGGDNQEAKTSSCTVNESRSGGVGSVFMDNLRKDAETDDDVYQSVDVVEASRDLATDDVGCLDEPEIDDVVDGFIDNLKGDEESDDDDRLVSVDGLEKMISNFLGGIGDYSRSDIEKFFNQVNIGQSGLIDQDEFDHFIDLAKGERRSGLLSRDTCARLKKSMRFDKTLRMMGSNCSGDVPPKELGIGDESSIRYVENMARDIEKPLKDWSMFYCGASSFIEKNLRDISEKYKIDVGVERFDW